MGSPVRPPIRIADKRGRSESSPCNSLFFGALTMLTTPFLTDLDSRAAIKGSRDPLGVQPIWARLGRHVVGNLTTVSNSVRDFTVLLLGYHFAQCVADD